MIPQYPAERRAETLAAHRSDFDAFVALHSGTSGGEAWSTATDAALIRAASAWADARKINPTRLCVHDFSVGDGVVAAADARLLRRFSADQILERLMVLSTFNGAVGNLLAVVDLTQRDDSALGTALAEVRGSLFWETKREAVMARLVAGASERPDPFDVSIDRIKAKVFGDTGASDAGLSVSVFGQLFQQMRDCEADVFRRSERIFKVAFRGEFSNDYGGPYREALSTVCAELQSPTLPLLSAVEAGGPYALASASGGSEIKAAVVFLGRLIGATLRTRDVLSLHLTPRIWKFLVGQASDVSDVDAAARAAIDAFRSDDGSVTRDNFDDLFPGQTFCARAAADGGEVELFSGGAAVAVTFDNRRDYADALEAFKLREGASLLRALREVRVVCSFMRIV